MKIFQGSLLGSLVGLGFMWMLSGAVVAEEIKTFQFTGWDGKVALRSFSDEQSIAQSGVVTDLDKREITELEVKLNGHGYVYHPKFLKIDAGGGPILVQNRLQDLSNSSDISSTLFNIHTNLNFLDGKPYPFSIYYNRQNPLVAPSVNEHILQTNIKYGVKASVKKPVLPFLLTMEAFRLSTSGDGINLVINDQIDEFNVRMYRNEKRGGYNQVQMQANRHFSRSGSKQNQITPNTVTTNSFNYDSRLIFGDNDRFIFKNLLSYVQQDSVPSLKQIKAAPDFRWNHSETLYSFYRYNYLGSEQQGIDTKNHAVSIGFSSQRKVGISTAADVHLNKNTTTGFSLDSSGISGTVDYGKKFQSGNLKLHSRMGFDRFDRKTQAGQSTIRIFGEKHILAGTSIVDLDKEFIDVTTVSVHNPTRTQVYLETTDYRLIVIGSTTQIQRVLGGAIPDGEEVLVDYDYQTGGTFSHSSLDQQYQANFLIANYVNIFAAISKKDISLDSGAPTIALNSIQNISYGVTADYPLFEILTVGGEIRIEDQKEDIAPFKRQSKSVFLQFNLPRSTSLRLTAQQEQIEHQSSLEDVDLTRFSLRLRSRPFTRTILTLSAIDEEDVGGSQPRTLRDLIVKAEWHFRKLYLTLDARVNEETQGPFVRKRDIYRATLERRF